MKKYFWKNFQRKKKRRNKAKHKRNLPKIFKYKSENKPNSETMNEENQENEKNEIFPQQEFIFESFPDFQSNEDISNYNQDFPFPKYLDININDPNYQNDKII